MFKLASQSLWNRRGSAVLTILAIAVSVMLLLGVDRIREQTRANFANTVSGTDLIVGARTGQVQLLLSSVFHIGAMTNTLSWSSYEHLQQLPQVNWHVPLALGDSVQGFPVVGTTPTFFSQFQYGQRQSLEIAQGEVFQQVTEVVIGAQVARALDLVVGDDVSLAHGSGGLSFSEHGDHDFQVSGVLATTGTPVDKAVYVPLAGLSLVHDELDPADEDEHAHGHEHEHDHQSEHSGEQVADVVNEPPATSLSAVLIGLNSKPFALRLQRDINTYAGEPLTAIMPGMTLQQLWQTLSLFEQALYAIAGLVVVTGLLGMLTSLLASLRERRREIAVLRAVGARRSTIFGLLISETMLLTLFGCLAGVALLYLVIASAGSLLQSQLGINLALAPLSVSEWQLLGLIIGAGFLLSLIPAWRAYRLSLADGLTAKL